LTGKNTTSTGNKKIIEIPEDHPCTQRNHRPNE
jgi:hypothetical protein